MQDAIPSGGAGAQKRSVRVLIVDDNAHVAEALRLKFDRAGGFAWTGWLPSADTLIPTIDRECPQVVILDIDMPGRNPFEAIAEMITRCPGSRALMFSGHVRFELISRALEAGAWGYVSKNDGEDALIQAVRDVMADELAMSPEAKAAYTRGTR